MADTSNIFNLSDHRFASLVENIPGILYQCALDEFWTMKYISPGVEELTNFKASDFIGNKVRSYASIIHPADSAMVDQTVIEAVDKKTDYTIEYRILDSNGEIHWVYEKGRATYSDKGEPLWLDGIIFDLSFSKYTEQIESGSYHVLESLSHGDSLGEVLTKLALTIEKIWPKLTCSILVLDKEKQQLMHGAAPGLPDYYNEAINGLEIGENIGSCGHAAFTGKPCIVDNVLTHPNWIPFLELSTKVGFHACWSYPIMSKDNSVLGTFACYYNENKKPSEIELQGIRRATYLAGIAIQRKLEEDEIISAKVQAEKANKAKSEFLSRMSHEFRTPLNAILGFSQLFDLDENLNQEQKANVKEIYDSGHHLLELVNDILELSKIEAEKIDIPLSEINVTEVINKCIKLTTPMADEHKIKIINNAGDKTYSAKSNFLRLKQVLLNLISNAIKYNKENGTVTLTITLQENKRIRISVTDTGIGLTEEQCSILFTPFERFDTQHDVTDGIGIGLVISKNLIEKMEGEIGVDSSPGKGSTFWIELNEF